MFSLIPHTRLLSAARHLDRNVRTLYSLASMGVETYISTRQKVEQQFYEVKDKFKAKMLDFARPDSPNMIFTEDLKHIVHIVDSSESDMQLVENMMLKFAKQNKELRFGSFVFGPVVMRMYHYLNKPNEALKMFKSPEMVGFFDQLVSFQLLMDLLYRNDMHQENLDVFDMVKSKQLQGARHPKNCVVLCFASCYKLNNEESFLYAKNLWSELTKVGHYPMRRAATFFAALALQSNAPHIALEVLTSMKQQNYVTVRNLKVAALSDLNRPDDILPILRAVLEIDESLNKKHTFYEEIIQHARLSVQKSQNNDLIEEFDRIEKQLRNLGFIDSVVMSDILCSEITHFTTTTPEQKMMGGYKRGRTVPFQKRPGLQDLI